MKLSDLNPRLEGKVTKGRLRFDCPSGQPHKIIVHIHDAPFNDSGANKYWQASGIFPDTLTLTPSINEQHVNPETGEVEYQCWHGHITNGEIK